MRPISTRKHEWIVANMVPISTTKHKMTFGNLGILVIWGSIFWKARGGPPKINNYDIGSKTIGFSERFQKKTEFYDGEILINL